MSEDLRSEIRDAVAAVVDGHADGVPPSGEVHRPLWTDLADTGFALVGVPEERGGSGGGLVEAAALLDAAAAGAAAVPVAEVGFLAGWLLADAGLQHPGTLTLPALDEAVVDRTSGAARLTGLLRVPWGRHAEALVVLVRDGAQRSVAVLPAGSWSVAGTAENLAGEPRDVLLLDTGAPVGPTTAPTGLGPDDLLRRGALARTVQLAGAARAVLAATQRYVAEREQFGRPLARFQAVQQQLAALAGEVAAMQVAAGAAVLAVEAAEADPAARASAQVAVAAAKAVTSAGAQVVAATGHQLHGALGYTREHPLGTWTTRLWAWREEFGAEGLWQDQLAAAVTEQAAWWPTVTAAPGGGAA